MAGNLLTEDNSTILCESGNTLGMARKVDYKFCYILDTGTNTFTKVRFYEGTGSYTRSSSYAVVEETFAGSKTKAELVSEYNTQLLTYGTPIPEQT